MLRAWVPPTRQSPPPLGERDRKLIEDGCIVQAREERLLDVWCRKLRDELLLINAPVLASLQGSLDPDRAALLLTGSTRASTLKRYLGYRQWRLWLGEAKPRHPPGRPSDLVDYLLARRDEPWGRSTPEAILKAIAWVERVAEFEETLRATHGRLAWAAKDKITEILSEGARLIKRAGLYADAAGGLGLRCGTRYRLEDLGLGQASQDLGLATVVRPSSYHPPTTVLRRTKTSCPSRRIKELPVAISEHAYFLRSTWLRVGFDLLRTHANYKRDYLLPPLNQDGLLEKKPASYADAMVATAGLLGILGLPLEVQGYWTEHSERSVLPTGLSLMEVPVQDRDLLGRWKPEGSDTC